MLSKILCSLTLLSAVSAYLYGEELPIVLSLDRHNAILSRDLRRYIAHQYIQLREWYERWRDEREERIHLQLQLRELQSEPREYDDDESSSSGFY